LGDVVYVELPEVGSTVTHKVNPKPCTLHPKPYTLNPKLGTLNPKP